MFQPLAQITLVAGLVFGLWCLDKLQSQFGDALIEALGVERGRMLLGLSQVLWSHVLRQSALSLELIKNSETILRSLESSEEEIVASHDFKTYGVIELLGILQKVIAIFQCDSVTAAAHCAEHVINILDYELAFERGEKASLFHPLLCQTLAEQKRILAYLQRKEVFTEASLRAVGINPG